MNIQTGYGTCNGTFGELIQGVRNQQPFLITFPIPLLKSEAVLIPDRSKNEIVGHPSNTKAILACKKVSDMFGVCGGGTLDIRSNIPKGKGMASSSADIVAAIRAMADSYAIQIKNEEISKIATEIEPTDGVMYDGVVAYDYKNGKLIESFGDLPPFHIIGIDSGGSINTLQFNTQQKRYSYHDHHTFLEAYELMRTGIKNHDLTYICQASTLSARVNENILPKPYFKEFEQFADLYQAGIVVAHSGTMIGLLLDPASSHIEECQIQLAKLVNRTKARPFYYTQNKLHQGKKNLNHIRGVHSHVF